MSIYRFVAPLLCIVTAVLCGGCIFGGNPPVAPGNLTAEVISSTQIRLQWSDNSDNESGFRIERSFTGEGFEPFSSTETNVTSYTCTGLTPNTTYYFRVKAYNDKGDSPYSNVVNAFTSSGEATPTPSATATTETTPTISPAPTVSQTATPTSSTTSTPTATPTSSGSATPPAPSGLSATPLSASSIRLTWTDKSSNESGFKIFRGTSGTGVFSMIGSVAANTSTYDSTGLNSGTTYYFKVMAYNTAGDSAYSGTANATTTTTAPAAPGSLSAGAMSTSSIHLEWVDNAADETGYCIERAAASPGPYSQIATVDTNVESYTNTGLTANTTYYYRVRAVKNTTYSSYSNIANAKTFAASNAPVLTGPSSATGPFELSWTFTWPGLGSSNDRYELEYSYSVSSGYMSLGTYTDRVSPYTVTITPDAADVGKFSYIRVRAYTYTGYTEYSNIVAVYVPCLGESQTFYPDYDNGLLKSSTNTVDENTVFQNGDLVAGTVYIYGAFVDTYCIAYSAFKFNINTSISGKTIDYAVLRLYPFDTPADFGNDFFVKPLSGSWNPATITFNNCPGTNAAYACLKSGPTTTAVPWEVDVTNIVQAWANGTLTNNGLLVGDNDIAWPGYTAFRYFDFYSKDASAAVRPCLYVEMH